MTKMNSKTGLQLERRQFLKSIAGAGVVAGAALSGSKFAQASDTGNEPQYAMLVDKHECVGCNACTRVCSENYDLPDGIYRTKIHRYRIREVEGELFKKNACLHCSEASCLMACPADAIYKDELGLTQLDNDICINCSYCIVHCPFDAIHYDRTRGINEKCTLCAPLIRAGGAPLCYEACPVDAIHFGSPDEMLELGQQRVAALKEEGYQDANLYGETELGGLVVLGVLAFKPEDYEYPNDPQISPMLRAWDSIPFAPAFVVVGGAAMVVNFLRTRQLKNELTQEEEEEDNE